MTRALCREDTFTNTSSAAIVRVVQKANLRKDYFWNTLGVFFQNALSPILIVIITRLNGINDSGLFSFAFSLAIIFWMIGMWGGRTYQVSDTKGEFKNVEYISVRLVLSVLTLVGALIFAALNSYDITKTVVIITLVVFKSLESIADALYGVLQSHNRLYVAGQSLFYKTLFGVIGFFVVDFFTQSIVLACIILTITNFLVVCFFDIPSSQHTQKLYFKNSIRHYIGRSFVIMKQCWPIFIVMFLTVFSLNIPRYFVDKFHPDQIGHFGILAMPVTLIVLIMSFILQPNVVELARKYNSALYNDFRKKVGKILLLVTLLGICVLAGVWAIGVWALDFIFGISFEDYAFALILITVGAILNAFIAVFVNVFVIMRIFKQQFFILLITNLALIVVAGPIVKTFGLSGAITLFVVTSLAQAFMLGCCFDIYLRKKAKKQ